MSNVNLDLLNSTKAPPSWPRGILVFSVIVFLLTISLWLSLKYYWLAHREKVLTDLEDKFETLRAEFPLEKEREVVQFERKLKILRHLLKNHIYFTNIMKLVEDLTHSQIYYKSWSYDAKKDSLNITGVAKNQEILSQEVNSLVNHPEEIKAVVVKHIKTASEGGIEFDLELYFTQPVAKYQTSTSTLPLPGIPSAPQS